MLSAEIEPLTESSQRGRHSVTYTTLHFPADTDVGAAGQGAGAAAGWQGQGRGTGFAGGEVDNSQTIAAS